MFKHTQPRRCFTFLIIVALITIATISAFPVTADAGIIDAVKSKFTDFAGEKLIGYGVSGLLALLGFIGSTFGIGFLVKLRRYKRSTKELTVVLQEVYKATRKESPGGAKITGDEFDDILDRIGGVGKAVVADVKGTV